MRDSGGSSSPTLRVLVADDHPVFRDGLRLALREAEGIELVGEVDNGVDAVAAAEDLRPDVVLMDLQMPGLSGIDATRQIVAADPDAAIVMLTMREDDLSVAAALNAGARGYLVKQSSCADIVRAIESVARGHAVFGPNVADRLIGYLAGSRGGVAAFPQLTDRERQVLELIARGRDNRAIARELFLSDKTVRNHVSNILTKIQVPTRAEAIVLARQAGLGQ